MDDMIIIDKFLADGVDIQYERMRAWSIESEEEEIRQEVLQAIVD